MATPGLRRGYRLARAVAGAHSRTPEAGSSPAWPNRKKHRQSTESDQARADLEGGEETGPGLFRRVMLRPAEALETGWVGSCLPRDLFCETQPDRSNKPRLPSILGACLAQSSPPQVKNPRKREGNTLKPGKIVFTSAARRCRTATSANTSRKSVVSAKSRPS